jgi:hypothetical protein
MVFKLDIKSAAAAAKHKRGVVQLSAGSLLAVNLQKILTLFSHSGPSWLYEYEYKGRGTGGSSQKREILL